MEDDPFGRDARKWEAEQQQLDRIKRWTTLIHSAALQDDVALRSITESLNKFRDDIFWDKITRIECERLVMDLIAQAIAAGAFSGAGWLSWRVRLADNPSFHNAVQFFSEYAPPGFPTLVPTQHIGHSIASFAYSVEKFIRPSAPTPSHSQSPDIAPAKPLTQPKNLEPIHPDYYCEILIALLELKAFDQNSRKSLNEIASVALPREDDPKVLARQRTGLQKSGHIRTKVGRNGGAWLTAMGRSEAERLSKL